MNRYKIPYSIDLVLFVAEIKNYGTEIIVCQELTIRCCIMKNIDVLLAPALIQPNQVYLICRRCDINNYLMLSTLEEHLLIPADFNAVSDSMYQYCLSFSLQVKLSPCWNKVNNVWINGLDFLISSQVMEAVSWEILLADGILTSSIEPSRVRLPLIELADYDVDKDKLCTTGRASMRGSSVYVLPQLLHSSAVFVSTYIPADCPFSTYSQVRQYWKDKYGLSLPDDTNMLYIQVRFEGFHGSKLFTYPMCCVRSSNFIWQPSRDSDQIAQKFSKDLIDKCPNICGMPLVQLEGPALIPVCQLYPATLDINFANLESREQKQQRSQPQTLLHEEIATPPMDLNYQDKYKKDVRLIIRPGNGKKYVPCFTPVRVSSCIRQQVYNYGVQGVTEADVHKRPFPKTIKEIQPYAVKLFSGNDVLSNALHAKEGAFNKANEKKTLQIKNIKKRVPSATDPLALKILSSQERVSVCQPRFIPNSTSTKENMALGISEPVSAATNLHTAGISTLQTKKSISLTPLTEASSEMPETAAVPPIDKISIDFVKTTAAKKTKPTHDVKTLFEQKLLHKANIPSLIAFCKENKIKVRCKDKKNDLLEKVSVCLAGRL